MENVVLVLLTILLPSVAEGRQCFPDIFCGRGPSRQDCDPGHECVISPIDAFAMCCRESVPECLQKKDPGPCKAAIPRYYYNAAVGKCEKFIYGGCLGNDNNFKTKKACMKKCDGVTPPCPPGKSIVYCKVDPCMVTKCPKFPKAKCRSNYCGGCNAEFFLGGKDVTSKCTDRCQQPKETGPCRGAFPRWFYNTNTKKCEKFIYGGCGGNRNNFKKKSTCKKKCQSGQTPKPGSCPSAKGKIGPCIEACHSDADCPGKQKCCFNGCGHTCQDPNSAPKPGSCPSAKGKIGPCIEACRSDADCPGKQKCCFNGCGHTCQDPNSAPKSGSCPSAKGKIGPCIEACHSDADCPGKQKCCFNGCGHTCQDPTSKPGFCPSTVGMIGICVELCSSDADCKGDLKCCSNGCGHTCQYPKLCPPDKPVVNCLIDPCSIEKCPRFPKAECRSNFCGGCNFDFFLKGKKVTKKCKKKG